MMVPSKEGPAIEKGMEGREASAEAEEKGGFTPSQTELRLA